MYQKYQIDYKQLNRFFNQLVKDILDGTMQTHISFEKFEV